MSLTGRTAWVTGGSAGIGAGIVSTLRAAGARVGVLDLDAPGDGCADAFVRCDLADPAAPGPAAAVMRDALGDADVLVNNAGVTAAGPVDELPAAEWERVLRVNLTAAFLLVAAVVPPMREQGWGRIVSISSNNAFRAQPGRSAYAASKAGLVALTKVVALEGAAHGITANAVAPGLVDTDLTRASLGGTAALQGLARDSRLANPMGLLLDPHDVASAVAFLASEGARAVTGHTLHVNAGSFMA